MLLPPKQVSGADAANIPELRGGSQCYCVAGGCSTAARKLNRDGSLSTVSDRDWGGPGWGVQGMQATPGRAQTSCLTWPRQPTVEAYNNKL